jgi:hypothetical protein
VILVGVIDDLGRVPYLCKEAVPQTVTFRVEQVLWGKWPGATIPIVYDKCSHGPLPAPPFIKGSRLIVFAHPITSNDRFSMVGGYDSYDSAVVFGNPSRRQDSSAELGLFTTTDLNMKTVLGALRSQGFAQSYVRRFVSSTSGPSGLIFLGTVEDLGHPQSVCTVLLLRYVTFRIDRVLWGAWPERNIRIAYHGRCGPSPLPSPPFTKGIQLIVLARTYKTGPDSEVSAFGGDAWDGKPAPRMGLYPVNEENIKAVERIISEVGLASSKH